MFVGECAGRRIPQDVSWPAARLYSMCWYRYTVYVKVRFILSEISTTSRYCLIRLTGTPRTMRDNITIRMFVYQKRFSKPSILLKYFI